MFGDSAFSFGHSDQGLGEMLVGRAAKPDPGMENGSNDDEFGSVLNYGSVNGLNDGALPISFASGTESFKKRKADHEGQNLKVNSEEKYLEKKMKELAEDERSKTTEQNINSKNKSTTTSNNKKKGPSADNSKGSDGPKTDYIHVRARRGQATDSHSLAERVRREKISERMRYLQDLVPGCNQIIGKAGMLDEIINYVQSLQTQVEFLSMKLSTVNPGLDFDPEKYLLAKEMFPAHRSTVPDNISPAHFPFVTIGQGISHSDFEMGVNPPIVTPRKTINSPAPIPEAFLDSSCLNQFQHLPWDVELQNLYSMEFQQGRSPILFTSQPITDCTQAGHVKLEK